MGCYILLIGCPSVVWLLPLILVLIGRLWRLQTGWNFCVGQHRPASTSSSFISHVIPVPSSRSLSCSFGITILWHIHLWCSQSVFSKVIGSSHHLCCPFGLGFHHQMGFRHWGTRMVPLWPPLGGRHILWCMKFRLFHHASGVPFHPFCRPKNVICQIIGHIRRIGMGGLVGRGCILEIDNL